MRYWILGAAIVIGFGVMSNADYKHEHKGLLALDDSIHAQALQLIDMQRDVDILSSRWTASQDTIRILKNILAQQRQWCVVP